MKKDLFGVKNVLLKMYKEVHRITDMRYMDRREGV